VKHYYSKSDWKNVAIVRHCVTLTFAERFRLAVSLSENKPLSAN